MADQYLYQYIVNYDIYHNPTDTLTLAHHLNQYKELFEDSPDVVVADSGNGSEQNYEFMESEQIDAFVKYNYFHQEQKSKGKVKPKNAFKPEHLHYDKQGDYFICPMGQKMTKRYDTHPQTKSGYQQTYSVCQAQNCKGCPFRGACHKSKTNRKIQINWNLKQL